MTPRSEDIENGDPQVEEEHIKQDGAGESKYPGPPPQADDNHAGAKDMDENDRSPARSQDNDYNDGKEQAGSPDARRSRSRSRSRSPRKSPVRSVSREKSPVGRNRSPSRSPVRSRSPIRSRSPVRARSRSPVKSRSRSRDRDRRRSRSRDRRSRSRDRRRSRSRDRNERPRYRSRSRSRDRYRRSPPRRSPGPYGPPRRTPPPAHLHLFVAGLNFICNERELEKKFSRYGRVREARIVRNPHSGESRGFGFVVMQDELGVDDAIRNLDGRDWNGRRLLVERARNIK